MARIDYYAIEEKLQEILLADTRLLGAEIRVEGEMDFNAAGSWVGIYLERRDPAPQQSLDAGRSTRYRLQLSLWCWCMDIEDPAKAVQARDALLAKVEQILMENRTIGGLVDMSWLQGGQLPTGRLDGSQGAIYLSGGEIVLIAEARTGVSA